VIKVLIAAAVVVVALTTTTACSSSRSTTSTPPLTPGASTQEQKALSDGKVTSSEYHTSFRAFENCVSRAGYAVTVGGIKGNVVQYTTPSIADPKVDACYSRYFQDVDTAWQSENGMYSDAFKSFELCLRAKGVTPAKSVEGIVAQLKQAHIDQAQCLASHQFSTPQPTP
jgi:hypothetical protein